MMKLHVLDPQLRAFAVEVRVRHHWAAELAHAPASGTPSPSQPRQP
jgi:hypothetical protein